MSEEDNNYIVFAEDSTAMMQEEYDVIGGESTCNKYGIAYTASHNPLFI